jgi:hypothetical protein
MDALIYNRLRAVATETDEAKREELKAESKADLGAHFRANPNDMEELAFELLNNAWSDAVSEDILGRIIDTRTVGLGDIDYIDEDLRGLKAYWQGKGGQIISDILRYERTQMPREEIVAAIDMHQDELALDFWGAFNRLTMQAQEKMRLLPVERLIELIQAGITAGATYGTFAAATLSDSQVDSVLDPVATAGNGEVTIIGTRVAIRKLARVALEFGDNLNEQIFRTGQIAQYKGYPVVQVENFENFEGNYVLPNDELWLVSRNAGRLTYYGGQAKVQQLRLPSFFFRWETARDAGMLLYGIARGRIGRIVLT